MSDFIDDQEQDQINGYRWVWSGADVTKGDKWAGADEWWLCQVCGARSPSRSKSPAHQSYCRRKQRGIDDPREPDDHWNRGDHDCARNAILCRLEKKPVEADE